MHINPLKDATFAFTGYIVSPKITQLTLVTPMRGASTQKTKTSRPNMLKKARLFNILRSTTPKISK